MVDALALGASGATHGGSSPLIRTNEKAGIGTGFFIYSEVFHYSKSELVIYALCAVFVNICIILRIKLPPNVIQ